LAEKAGVEVVDIPGRHLYDPDEVGRLNKGKPTMTLHQWQSVSDFLASSVCARRSGLGT
jgi:cryptochrome